MAYFDLLANLIQTVDQKAYSGFAAIARQRLAHRDEDDWPILAAALAIGCPIYFHALMHVWNLSGNLL